MSDNPQPPSPYVHYPTRHTRQTQLIAVLSDSVMASMENVDADKQGLKTRTQELLLSTSNLIGCCSR